MLIPWEDFRIGHFDKNKKEEMPINKSIYIIKNTVNDLCYIGQSVDYNYRFRKHKEEALRGRIEYRDCLHTAMRELGVDKFYVEVLEENVDNPDEREIYYINKLNTIYPNGYNVASGGMRYPNLSGVRHHNATVKSEEELNQITQEIIHTDMSYADIARKHGLNWNAIWDISNGETYKREWLEYPLREPTINKEKLDRLTYDLKYSNYTYDELSGIYGISKSQIKAINYGNSWHRDYLEYPLRKECFIGDDRLYDEIQKDLLSTNLSFDEISSKYKCSASTVRRVNIGETSKNDNYTYPLRKCGKLGSKEILDIHNMLMDIDISINDIARMFNVSDATIKRINSGKTKKYKDERFSYPIRK